MHNTNLPNFLYSFWSITLHQNNQSVVSIILIYSSRMKQTDQQGWFLSHRPAQHTTKPRVVGQACILTSHGSQVPHGAAPGGAGVVWGPAYSLDTPRGILNKYRRGSWACAVYWLAHWANQYTYVRLLSTRVGGARLRNQSNLCT